MKRYLRNAAIQHNRHVRLWRRFGKPSLVDWTEYLRRHGGFRAVGEDCAINPSVMFTDPHMTQIGSNVRIAGGIVMGHDGSVNMLNRAYGTKLDAVGPIVIADNVFIGIGCIILAGTRIGPNTIIGAGSVVAGKVDGDGVYAGNPLRKIRTMDEHMTIMQRRNEGYPWRSIIEGRSGSHDPDLEPTLRKQRVAHFFK